ncbi:MAG: flagellar hook-associated protein FlgL [Thermodesulfobacteriota bacterium]|nr:flagellar hook-associated protein FlgL [Thermodesulfobacteriota bacterium]
MRVTHSTIYDTAQYNLGKNLTDLEKANEIVSTGKRINRLADDPVGLAQVLGLKSSVAAINQYKRNIGAGETWLGAGETALDSVNNLISEAEVICEQMANGTYSASERISAAERIQGILEQIVQFANTEVNGQYIFSGGRTDTRPFTTDNESNPQMVTYAGDDSPFSIKSGPQSDVVVGFDGAAVFGTTTVTIDAYNNSLDFSEDYGATELTATIPDGTYTADELAAEIQTQMRAVSANSVDYEVSYDAASGRFMIRDGPFAGDVAEVQLLWNSGTNSANSIGAVLGFSATADSTGSDTYAGSDGIQWGIFKTMLDVKDALETDDADRVAALMTVLGTHYNSVTSTMSEAGSKALRLELRKTTIEDLKLQYTDRQSSIEDADATEAISDLSQKEFAYKASLAATSKVISMSLADYL